MKTYFDRLVECEGVVEWLENNNKKLIDVGASGSGADLRQDWSELKLEGIDNFNLTSHISRLLVPKCVTLKGAIFDISPSTDISVPSSRETVKLAFTEIDDWQACFPIDRTEIFKAREISAWAALGLCGNGIGLAVFSKGLKPQNPPFENVRGALVTVQPAPEELVRKLEGSRT